MEGINTVRSAIRNALGFDPMPRLMLSGEKPASGQLDDLRQRAAGRFLITALHASYIGIVFPAGEGIAPTFADEFPELESFALNSVFIDGGGQRNSFGVGMTIGGLACSPLKPIVRPRRKNGIHGIYWSTRGTMIPRYRGTLQPHYSVWVTGSTDEGKQILVICWRRLGISQWWDGAQFESTIEHHGPLSGLPKDLNDCRKAIRIASTIADTPDADGELFFCQKGEFEQRDPADFGF